MRSFVNIHHDIEKSKGKDIHFKLRGLGQTKTILNRNYFWLLQLNKYMSQHVDLMYVKNRNKLEDFQIEFARHLHNYLAAVKSLVDHTRVLKRKLLLSNKFEELYKKQRNETLGTDTITFIQQLREYAQHYELLPSGVLFSVDKDDDEKITLILTTSTLLSFSNWKQASLRILNASPENVDIFKLLQEYQDSINEFYKWFYKEVENNFKKELGEFDQLIEEMRPYQERLTKNETDD